MLFNISLPMRLLSAFHSPQGTGVVFTISDASLNVSSPSNGTVRLTIIVAACVAAGVVSLLTIVWVVRQRRLRTASRSSEIQKRKLAGDDVIMIISPLHVWAVHKHSPHFNRNGHVHIDDDDVATVENPLHTARKSVTSATHVVGGKTVV